MQRTKEDVSIYQFAGNGSVPAAIGEARREVAESPEDAAVRMKLAQALIEQINADRASAPMYAGELLTTLNRALELDPKRPDVYEALIGYYVSAPPIAGGSIEKARELAKRLAEIDADAGRAAAERIASMSGRSH